MIVTDHKNRRVAQDEICNLNLYVKDKMETASLPNSRVLVEKFSVYNTSNLSGVSASDFEASLRSRIGSVDSELEGYSAAELQQQRDLSVKFHWGHNHDFGEFELQGRMGDRHLDLMSDFVDLFPVSLDSFAGKSVLDVGCWTGGTTLLLAAIDAQVFAIEEVKKYSATVEYLAKSFGLCQQVTSKSFSIYECNTAEFRNRFDLVYFPGVIYHLSDPVLALRILFNSLKIGGEILIESAGIDSDDPICKFEGNAVFQSGNKNELNRGGWNWFLPSPSALDRMMFEAGFNEIETVWSEERGRVYGYGRKTKQTGICKAGLSIPGIP